MSKMCWRASLLSVLGLKPVWSPSVGLLWSMRWWSPLLLSLESRSSSLVRSFSGETQGWPSPLAGRCRPLRLGLFLIKLLQASEKGEERQQILTQKPYDPYSIIRLGHPLSRGLVWPTLLAGARFLCSKLKYCISLGWVEFLQVNQPGASFDLGWQA